MANYYSVATARCTIPCTEEKFKKLQSLLTANPSDPNADPDEIYDHNYAISFQCGQLFLYSDNSDRSPHEEHLPTEFLLELGHLLEEARLPHLTVGVAFICSKIRPDSHGGTEFRIYPDGSIAHAEYFYACDSD